MTENLTYRQDSGLSRRRLLGLAALQSAAAVDLMYHAGGGSSIHLASPLQRCFRDVHVVTQHQRVSPFVIQQAGRIYAGLGEPPPGF